MTVAGKTADSPGIGARNDRGLVGDSVLNVACLAAVGLAAFYVVTAVLGAIRHYSPVPFWDMWAAVLFYDAVQHGDTSIWWAQHNEHRIFFSKVLFWLDFTLANGNMAYLVAANYALAMGVVLSFGAILVRITTGMDRRIVLCLAMLLVVLAFSMAQAGNFVEPFQNPFFTAIIFPVLGLYALHLSKQPSPRGRLYFAGACILGLASAGTLASGVLALPLMVVAGAVLKLGWTRLAILVGLTLLMLVLFFVDYQPTAENATSTPVSRILDNPVASVRYVLLYLGLPVYYMVRYQPVYGPVAGAAFLCSAAICALITWQRRLEPQFGLRVVLLLFIAYIVGTAVVTASGRVELGVGQVTSHRYVTPMMAGWSAMLLLAVSLFPAPLVRPHPALAVLFLVPLALLPEQMLHLKDERASQFEYMVAALALQLGVKDDPALTLVFPSAEAVVSYARPAIENRWGVFNEPELTAARDAIGGPAPPVQAGGSACLGAIELAGTAPLPPDQKFVNVKGWLFAPNDRRVPSVLYLVDRDERVVGYALVGGPRPEIAQAIGKEALTSGFKGYLLASFMTPDARDTSITSQRQRAPVKEIVLVGQKPACRIVVTVPLA